jgi:hypothetical protein
MDTSYPCGSQRAITLAVYLCQQHGLGSLRFADLLTS